MSYCANCGNEIGHLNKCPKCGQEQIEDRTNVHSICFLVGIIECVIGLILLLPVLFGVYSFFACLSQDVSDIASMMNHPAMWSDHLATYLGLTAIASAILLTQSVRNFVESFKK